MIKQNQYIQVNNLTITPDDINRLPDTKKTEFEKYLLQTFRLDEYIESDPEAIKKEIKEIEEKIRKLEAEEAELAGL